MRRLVLSLGFLALLVAPAFGATWNRPGSPLAVSSSTDNAVVRFDGASGAQQNSGVTIDDSGNVALAPGATVDGKDVSTLGTGTGDFVGPASSTDNAICRYDGSTGKLSQNSGVTIDDSGNVALAPGATVDGKDVSTLGTGDLVGPASSTDNAVVRFDGTTGKLAQNSGVTFADTGQIATPGGITANGSIQARSTTGIPAGGTAGSGFTFYSATNFGLFGGSGAPTLSAAKGSIYMRSDGTGTNDRAYVNTDGGTTWAAFTTAN